MAISFKKKFHFIIKQKHSNGSVFLEYSRRKSDFLDYLYFVKGGSFFLQQKIEPLLPPYAEQSSATFGAGAFSFRK
jgi:hypothetical protein